jgi:hypothetical protein
MKIGFTSFNFTVLLVIGIFFSSCRKKELPVSSPDLGAITTTAIETSSNYERIVYFDLGTNSNKGVAFKINWDLGFSCNSETPYIILNTAKIMLAAKITDKTFAEVNSTSGITVNGRPDHPSGRMDSLAIQGGGVYILDRGYDIDGNLLGHFKMEVIENNATHFKGKFANIDGSNEQTVTIQKNTAYNFVYMNWSATGTITTPTIEPEKEEWDLVFTQYTEIFHEPEYMPYSVTGCLTNTYNTQALRVTNLSFEEIDLEKAESLLLSNDRNAIGYNWKEYQFDQGVYVVDFLKVYVIKDSEGYYYKLRFVDFYNQVGEKGTPTFEFQGR